MSVFLMVRRRKTTIFLDCKENTTVLEIKKMIAGITKVDVEDQRLYYNDEILEDNRCLSEYYINDATAKAQSPATIGLAFREFNSSDSNKFEKHEITPLSTPPELPDVMKTPDNAPSQLPLEQH
ncbi:elongin-B-like [Tetranychus urticae]|uniref:elongin-B-like n=1 Tax=Tetranychus urticae TaxID=32264 RepID=UPI00077BE7D5|nr:elongin-B-like [Tetranychus urticae]